MLSMTGATACYSDALQTELGPERVIDPALVLDGQPVYRSKVLHTTPDQRCPAMLWDCTRGKFRVYFDGDEVVYILEGRAIVHDDDGRITRLGPGDTALFPRGTSNVWEVPHYVKKLCMQRLGRRTTLSPVARATRIALSKLRRAFAAMGRQPKIEWREPTQRMRACHS